MDSADSLPESGVAASPRAIAGPKRFFHVDYEDFLPLFLEGLRRDGLESVLEADDASLRETVTHCSDVSGFRESLGYSGLDFFCVMRGFDIWAASAALRPRFENVLPSDDADTVKNWRSQVSEITDDGLAAILALARFQFNLSPCEVGAQLSTVMNYLLRVGSYTDSAAAP